MIAHTVLVIAVFSVAVKETESARQIQNAVQDGLLKTVSKGDKETLRMPEINDPVVSAHI